MISGDLFLSRMESGAEERPRPDSLNIQWVVFRCGEFCPGNALALFKKGGVE